MGAVADIHGRDQNILDWIAKVQSNERAQGPKANTLANKPNLLIF